MNKIKKEMFTILALSIPIFLTQISQTLISVTNTIMSGSFNITDMAAVALGNSIWLPVILYGHGFLLALTPTISHLNGSGNHHLILHRIKQGFLIAFIISLLTMLLFYNSNYFINYFSNIDIEISKKSIKFIRYLLWGVPGYFFYHVLQCKCEGLLHIKPGMIIGFLGLIINIISNYVFIYGKLGFPKLGGIGCGLATSVVYWFMFLSLFFYVRFSKNFNYIRSNQNTIKNFDFLILKKIFFLGIPLAFSLFFEITLFSLVAFLIAPLGKIAVSSHQIALNFSSLMFVIPLSICITSTIRIGYLLGKKDKEKAKISSWCSIFLGCFLSLITSLITIIFNKKISLLYNNDILVSKKTSELLLISSLYQITDSIQIISNGVLRGYKDTKFIFIITFFSYWFLGLPIGYILAKTNLIINPIGTKGFWFGFIFGLTSSSILMIIRILFIQKKNK